MSNTNLDKDKYLSINNFIQNATGSKTVETVNLKSGKLGVAQRIFSAKGARLPLNLHLTYNPTYANATQIFTDSASGSTQGNLLAKGWKFNYALLLTLIHIITTIKVDTLKLFMEQPIT